MKTKIILLLLAFALCSSICSAAANEPQPVPPPLSLIDQQNTWLSFMGSIAAYWDGTGTDAGSSSYLFAKMLNQGPLQLGNETVNFANSVQMVLPATSKWKLDKGYLKAVNPAAVLAIDNTSKNHIYLIAFRGTDYTKQTPANPVLTDVLAIPVKFMNSGTSVHAGFYYYAEAVEADPATKAFIVQFINDTNPGKRLIVGGTSLGAAAAPLFGAMLYENRATYVASKTLDMNQVYVNSTAVPAMGYPDFAEYYYTKVVNCLNINRQDDYVPVVPEMAGYVHYGVTIYAQSQLANYHDADMWMEHLNNPVYVPYLETLTPALSPNWPMPSKLSRSVK